jgi:1-acyl-sn-glycerol-3-phosphate acyltransferase
VFRPSSRATVIDFNGRKGYVRTALRAGVPIVPVVSLGGHEDQIHISRGELIAKLFKLEERLRTKYVPVTFGFPFGLTLAFPPNLPLPTKIRTQVLDPIDIVAEFGEDPDIAEVDQVVRERMQTAINELKRRRRFPVLG